MASGGAMTSIARTPGSRAAVPVSIVRTLACGDGERRIRACNIPGSFISTVYRTAPVDLGAPVLPSSWFADDLKLAVHGQWRRLAGRNTPLDFTETGAGDAERKSLGAESFVSHDQAFRLWLAARTASIICG
jgi:hypothetical protein